MKLGPVVLSPGSVVGRNDEIVGHIEAVAMEIGNDDNIDVFGGNHALPMSTDSNRLPGAHVVTPMTEIADRTFLSQASVNRKPGRRLHFEPY